MRWRFLILLWSHCSTLFWFELELSVFVCVFLGRGLRSLLIVSQQKNGDEANVRTDGPGYPHVVCQPLSDQNHLGDGHQSTPVLPGQEAEQSEHLFYFPNWFTLFTLPDNRALEQRKSKRLLHWCFCKAGGCATLRFGSGGCLLYCPLLCLWN